MMKAVNDIAKTHRVPLRVLIEKRMACGIGVCLSCVCKTTAPSSGYSRVCKEGPIFDASEIIWD
jgi:dihydroorotate dehydrogenase electron transfer subunit